MAYHATGDFNPMSKYRCTLTLQKEAYRLFSDADISMLELEAIGNDKIEVISDVIDMKESLTIRRLTDVSKS